MYIANEKLTAEQRTEVAKWVERWTVQDFSWEGLHGRTYEVSYASDPAFSISGEEFWAPFKDDLIEWEDGKRYTIFHLPPFFQSTPPGPHFSKYGMDDHELMARLDAFRAMWEGGIERAGGELLRRSILANGRNPDQGHWMISFGLDGTSFPIHTGVNPPYGKFCCYYRKLNHGLSYHLQDGLVLHPIHLENQGGIQLKNTTVLHEIALKSDPARFIESALAVDGGFVDYITLKDIKMGKSRMSNRFGRNFLCQIDNAVFESIDARGTGLEAIYFLEGVSKNGDALFDANISSGSFNIEFHAAISKIKQHFRYKNIKYRLIDPHKNARNECFRRLEHALAHLKRRAQDRDHDYDALKIHNYEIWCREKNSSYSFSERFVSSIYRYVSMYGTSIGMPLIWSALMMCAFAIPYAAIFSSAKYGFEPKFSLEFMQYFVEGLNYSAAKQAGFIPWANPTGDKISDIEVTLRELGDLRGFAARMLAFSQTALSAVLLFLTGLACKRKFKVSDK